MRVQRIWHTIYCGKCKGEGKPEAAFIDHNTVNCPSLASLSRANRTEMEDRTNVDDYNYTEDNYQQDGGMPSS